VNRQQTKALRSLVGVSFTSMFMRVLFLLRISPFSRLLLLLLLLMKVRCRKRAHGLEKSDRLKFTKNATIFTELRRFYPNVLFNFRTKECGSVSDREWNGSRKMYSSIRRKTGKPIFV